MRKEEKAAEGLFCLFSLLVVFLFFQVGQAIGATVQFTDDVKVDLEGVNPAFSIAAGLWCNSLDVSGTQLGINGIMSNHPLTLKNDTRKVLELTQATSPIDLQILNSGFMNGFLHLWQENSTSSIDHLVGLEQVNKNYTVKVDNNLLPHNPFNSGDIGEITFNRTDSGDWETYTINFTIYPTDGSALELNPFDTNISSGVAFNSIMWEGSQPELDGEANCTGPDYKCALFQIATSNSSDGPWDYLGPDCTAQTYYSPDPDTPQEIGCFTDHYNQRYYKIKIILYPESDKNITPEVEKVIVNYAP